MPKKGNRIIQKISKKATGSKVDTVADFVDLIAQIILEYVNQRYKIRKKIEDVKNGIFVALYSLKRAVIRSALETTVLITGVLSLIVGVVMIITNFVDLEYVLVGYGILAIAIIALTIKLKP